MTSNFIQYVNDKNQLKTFPIVLIDNGINVSFSLSSINEPFFITKIFKNDLPFYGFAFDNITNADQISFINSEVFDISSVPSRGHFQPFTVVSMSYNIELNNRYFNRNLDVTNSALRQINSRVHPNYGIVSPRKSDFSFSAQSNQEFFTCVGSNFNNTSGSYTLTYSDSERTPTNYSTTITPTYTRPAGTTLFGITTPVRFFLEYSGFNIAVSIPTIWNQDFNFLFYIDRSKNTFDVISQYLPWTVSYQGCNNVSHQYLFTSSVNAAYKFHVAVAYKNIAL